MTGIGRDRIVDIAVEGPTIQSATITVMTRNAPAVSTPRDAFAPKTVYGATFDHPIPPGRALTGVVRDKRTGRPLAGVYVGRHGDESPRDDRRRGALHPARLPQGGRATG